MTTDDTKRRLPWEDRCPIYKYIQEHLNKDGVVDEESWILPDEKITTEKENEYEPGLADWFESANDVNVDPAFINHLVDIFERYAQTGIEKDKIAIYNILKKNKIIGYFEKFINELGKRGIPIFPHMQEISRWMVCKAPDREVVKMGIILLGLTRESINLNVLRTVAKHEEFVFYVGEALIQMIPTWDLILVELIKPFRWWGRYQSVELLAFNTERKEVKEWLVRQGHRKFLITSYLSLTCAEYGDLRGELLKEKWDKELLQAAQIVIIDVLQELKGATTLEFGGDVIRLYLKHELGKRKGIMQYYILHELMHFFDQVAIDETLLTKLGLQEEYYNDIWIDVNEEFKKAWCVKLKNRCMRLSGSMTSYFSRAYDWNCD